MLVTIASEYICCSQLSAFLLLYQQSKNKPVRLTPLCSNSFFLFLKSGDTWLAFSAPCEIQFEK